MAISRKGNVGNEHAPASSPAVAHRRAKRTEWRMRGIEPYNKIIVVFPSSVLPSRRFGNPPFPEGEGLIGCVVILSISNAVVAISRINQTNTLSFRALVEKSPTIEMKTSEHEYPKANARASLPAGGVSPPRPTPNRSLRDSFPPRGRLNRLRTRIPQILARTVTVPCPRRLTADA